MSESILLKKEPKIEFLFSEDGFQIIDEQTDRNNGFYSYKELQSIELNKVWFPKLSVWMRIITTFLNGVPYFPDADTYKTASLIIHGRKSKIGVWLTDTAMANQAKRLKAYVDNKSAIAA